MYSRKQSEGSTFRSENDRCNFPWNFSTVKHFSCAEWAQRFGLRNLSSSKKHWLLPKSNVMCCLPYRCPPFRQNLNEVLTELLVLSSAGTRTRRRQRAPHMAAAQWPCPQENTSSQHQQIQICWSQKLWCLYPFLS